MGTTEYHRKYNIDRYHRLRAEYVEQLGGKCVKCDTTENLEFDHIDSTTKSLDIGKLLNYSKEVREAELEKCQLLCKTCHDVKTVECGDNPTVVHGGGLTGKRNCYCLLCAPLKREYNRQWKRNKNMPR